MKTLASYGLAFVVCCGLLHLLRPVALRIGLVDEPSERKSHQGSVPLIGGVAMFCGFALATLTLDVGLTAYRGFFAASAILVVVGILDDMHELSSRVRFGAQILAAGIMAYWGGWCWWISEHWETAAMLFCCRAGRSHSPSLPLSALSTHSI